MGSLSSSLLKTGRATMRGETEAQTVEATMEVRKFTSDKGADDGNGVTDLLYGKANERPVEKQEQPVEKAKAAPAVPLRDQKPVNFKAMDPSVILQKRQTE